MKSPFPTLAVLTLAVGGLLTGCCNIIQPPPKPVGNLPAPISMEQQLADLNARAVALPRIRAKASDGNVQVVYPDDHGKPVTSPAGSGALLLEQVYATHSDKLLLSVRAELQDIFGLGRNEQLWWAIQRHGKRQAWTGPVRPVTARDPQSFGELFAALSEAIPQLLAITEIAPDSDEKIVMKVDDLHGLNDLLIIRTTGDGGPARIERELLIDRRTGNVQEVDLYQPDGQLLARATLTRYEPVTYKSNPPAAGSPVPTMPREVILDCPAQQFRLGLRLTTVEIPAPFPEDTFAPPNWQDENVQPQPVE